MEGTLAGYVAEHSETLLISDVYADSRFNSSVDKETGFTTRNMVVVPISDTYGNCTAVLQAINKIDKDASTVPYMYSQRLKTANLSLAHLLPGARAADRCPLSGDVRLE